MSTKQPDYPASAQRIITVTMPYQRVYAAPLPRHKWQLILPATGEVQVLTEDEFSETWVLESECPPAVRRLFDGFESYARWRFGRECCWPAGEQLTRPGYGSFRSCWAAQT